MAADDPRGSTGPILVLGDAHADVSSNRRALRAAFDASEANLALQVGDLLCYDLPRPTWFVAGNNEDFDVVDALRRGDASLGAIGPGRRDGRPTLLASEVVEIAGLRVAGLSGNYSPTRYERSRDELAGGRRRHFVGGEVDRAVALSDVDVFLAHETPHGLLRVDGYDPGVPPLNRIVRNLSPDLLLVGHHHRHAEERLGETRAMSLDPVWEAYYELDPETLEVTRYPHSATTE